ncbi:J domain-containing protein [Pyxidicoccus fallax]|uniref:J domain-containing protein n=1 Tax=Pyxidicoccus fallax TaxID=394095 RepID=UPI001FE2BA76|nr:J domain-containing protein [Pyxidicoccus fallax]
MRACPCCMEKLTSGLLGLGGRRLVGACEVCGDAVCQSCLGTRVLDVGAPGQQRRLTRKRVCRSCLWEHLTDRGERPPFPAPPGQRERAARAARESCTHPGVKMCMGFCPDCGDEVPWKAEHGNPACEACGAPSHRFFNCCWACGESFGEENEPQAVARGYRLEFDCDSDDCAGKLAWLMPHCPWCGEEKRWQPPDNGGLECVECESGLDRAWAFCVRCGAEAPLPDDCPRCGQELEEAQSAARCEQCRNLVCGDCFDVRVVASASGERQERLMCSTCGSAFPRAEDTDATADEEEQEASEDEAEEESEDSEAEQESEDEEVEDDEAEEESEDDEAEQDSEDEEAEDESADDEAEEESEDEEPEEEPRRRGPAADPRGRKTTEEPRGPRPSADPRGSRPSEEPRGPRPSADPRGSRPSAEPRGPRPSADPRGRKPEDDPRGRRPASAQPDPESRRRPPMNEEPGPESRRRPPVDEESEPRRRPPAAAPEPPPPTPWEVLGVTRDTPLPEVKRAFLALVAQYHPDKVAQLGPKLQALAQEETRRIIEAWEQVRRQSR